MSKYDDEFLKGLTDIYMSIMKRCVDTGELTQSDLIFISMYQRQLEKANRIPIVKRIVGAVKDISNLLNSDEESEDSDIDNQEEDVVDGI